MKKYKTWEVIKMLTEDNKLKFKTYDDYTLSGKGHNLLKACNDTGKEIEWSGNISLADEWTLIQQPVSFMDVVNSNKLVRAEHCYLDKFEPYDEDDGSYIQRMINGEFIEFDRLLYILTNNSNAEEIRDVIITGKWYIEED